jgi:pimeloyl-ACP methyl ester carboxylesterase
MSNRKPILLILHGALGDQKQMQAIADTFSSSFEVHHPNWPGHGDSPLGTYQYDVSSYVQFLLTYIESLQNTVYVFGYSMGGYIALMAALEKPNLFNRIITLATKLDWSPESAAREIKMLDKEKMLEKIPDYAQTLQKRHTAMGWEEVLSGTANIMQELGDHPYLTPHSVAALQVSVTMGIGDRDTMVSLAETIQIQQAIPNSSLYVLPQTPHPVEKLHLPYLKTILLGSCGLKDEGWPAIN